MTLHLPKFSDYAKSQSGYESVPGWFHRLDLNLFEMLLAAQLLDGVGGDLLEIGTYHGKSAIAMGYGKRDHELLRICDVFGDGDQVDPEGMSAYDGLTVEEFLKNFHQWHSFNPMVSGCPSDELTFEANERFRFAHIDGGHAYDVVSEDIRSVTPYVNPLGFVVVDDFNTMHTPGVAAAAWGAVMEDRLYPFILSQAKMYAAVSEDGYVMGARLADGFRQDWVNHEVHHIAGYDVVRVWK